jgi:CheY-like chemotaxis protein
MGGTIELVSKPGAGSTFTLQIPETPPIIKSSDQHWPVDDRINIRQTDQVILLIDDDPIFCQSIIDINRRQNLKTLLAGTGSEGLKLSKEFHPNGILLDLGLPDMEGQEVLHQLKSSPLLSDIPVYIVSGREKNAELLRLGALEYLQKPLDLDLIIRAEATLLNAKQGILLITNGSLNESDISSMLPNLYAKVISLSATITNREKLLDLVSKGLKLVIIDLGNDTTTQKNAIKITEELRRIVSDIGIIFYSSSPLNESFDAELRQYSDIVIIKSSASDKRFQENIEHFFKKNSERHTVIAPVISKTITDSKRLNDRHLLVVDDDPRNLFVITAALEQQGAKVDNALNGKHALEILTSSHPDLIVMDIMMPIMDGYETIKLLRADPRLASIPIIAVTAKAMPQDRQKALDAGANNYLSKPVDYEALINMVASLCERRP